MKKKQYQNIDFFFNTYTGKFVKTADDPGPFTLKIEHTDRVCKNADIIAREEGWDEPFLYPVLSAARLHDIGRFLQFETYKTFNDGQSENHAAIGVKVIKQHGVLADLEEQQQRLIVQSVLYHNAYQVPDGLPRDTQAAVKLVRDADKVDIYKVMTDLYLGSVPGQTSFITHHLPDDGRVEPSVVKDILEGRLIDFRNVKTLNSMKLLQISWLFDLNYPATLKLMRERGLIEKILSTMPACRETEQVREAAFAVLGQDSPNN